MAHFAQLDGNNVVTQVIVVGNDDTSDSNGVEVESIGVAFCQKLLGAETNWKQTSYNSNMRGNYAGIGYTYDSDNDVFYGPQPFDSWTLSSNWVWEAPISYPDDGNAYIWNENAYQGDNTQGWELVNE